MFAIIGLVVVIVSVLGGFAMAGGPMAVLLAWSEWVVICGTALGTVFTLDEGAAGTDEVARPRHQAFEGDAVALVLLLDALGFEVVDHDGRKVLSGQVRVGNGTLALGGIDRFDRDSGPPNLAVGLNPRYFDNKDRVA